MSRSILVRRSEEVIRINLVVSQLGDWYLHFRIFAMLIEQRIGGRHLTRSDENIEESLIAQYDLQNERKKASVITSLSQTQ